MAALKIKAEGAVLDHYWKIPAESIVVEHKNNNRYGLYQEKDLEDLLEDLDNGKGIETPLICRPLPDFQPLLVEGYRRHAAVTLWNSRHRPSEAIKLPVIVKEMNDDEALEANVAENVKRRSLTPMDIAVGIRNLTNSGRTDEEIARIYGGKSTAWVSRQRMLLRLDREIRARVHNEQIPGTSAIELAELSDEKRGLVVTTIERDYNGKFSVTNIRKVGREVGGFGDGVTPQTPSVNPDPVSQEADDDGKPRASVSHTPRRKQRTLKELNDYFDRWDLNPRLSAEGRSYIRLHIGMLSGKVSDEEMDNAILRLFSADKAHG